MDACNCGVIDGERTFRRKSIEITTVRADTATITIKCSTINSCRAVANNGVVRGIHNTVIEIHDVFTYATNRCASLTIGSAVVAAEDLVAGGLGTCVKIAGADVQRTVVIDAAVDAGDTTGLSSTGVHHCQGAEVLDGSLATTQCRGDGIALIVELDSLAIRDVDVVGKGEVLQQLDGVAVLGGGNGSLEGLVLVIANLGDDGGEVGTGFGLVDKIVINVENLSTFGETLTHIVVFNTVNRHC